MRLYGKTARGRLHQIYNDKQLLDAREHPNFFQSCQSMTKLIRLATPAGAARKWWAREDLNFRPHAYQARALTN